METSLLKTKLNIPPVRPNMVSRPRLTERLKEGLSYNLVLVSAPAGFGKTTLLSEWARIGQPQMRTAWVSLDEGDNDPVRFFEYFIAALQTLQPGYGEKILQWLHSSQLSSTESMLTVLINDFYLIKGNFVIVLDDYHLIESQQIHDGITYLIEHLPTLVHLVIATRADPPLPLAHFRGKGMILEIRTDDLRFTIDDAARLLKELRTPGISAKDIAALNERTEGWAVGLRMAALSMKGQKDISGFISAFTSSQRYVMDYLMEEVLQKQSLELRDFLMKTSVLERLTAPLCDTLTGRRDSEDILLSFERSGLFIVPLDESRQWYRYEHLFADLLRHQCEKVYGTEKVGALHRQASQWYEGHGLPDDAIHHAIIAWDWERVMGLIYAQYEGRRKRGEFNTLLGWFQAIPDQILRGHLRLYSKYTNLLSVAGQLDTAEAALKYLESTTHDPVLEGEIAFSRGLLYGRRGDQKRYLELCKKAFALLPPDDVAMRSRAAERIAHAEQRLGLLQEAEEWATKAYELGRQAGDIFAAVAALEQMAIVAAYQGRLKHAVEIFKKEIEIGGQMVSRDVLSMIQYWLNDLEGAAESARLSIEVCKLSGGAPIWPLFVQAQICLVRGDTFGAAADMDKLEQACRRDPSVDSFWQADYIGCRVTYAIQQGNLEEAARWGEQLPDISGMIAIDWHIPARLLLAQGKREAAAKRLQELYDGLIRFGTPLCVIRIRIYQAMATDNDYSALEFLTEALTMAEPEGIIRYFVDEGKLLKPLLIKALAQKITPVFTKKLLDIIEDEEKQRQARKQVPTPQPRLLSERELEVLRVLIDDIPNRQISKKLNISLNTVKTHIHHIIDKLEVKDRRQAVQRARDLKII